MLRFGLGKEDVDPRITHLVNRGNLEVNEAVDDMEVDTQGKEVEDRRMVRYVE